MKKHIIIFLASLFSFVSSHAQDASTRFKERTIYAGSHGYYINETILSRSALATHLNRYPASAAAYNSFKKNVASAKILGMGSIALTLAGGILIKDQPSLARGLLIGGLGCQLFSLPLFRKAGNHVQHAIRMYNVQVMSD